MQYEPSLQHWGIKGMKWGVRRYQNKDGTLTDAGRKRYKPNKSDKEMFGERGAQRIADRRNRGDSRPKALAKELGITVAKGLALDVSLGAAAYLYTSGKYKDIPKAAANLGRSAVSTYLDAAVVDNSGKVLSRYRNAVNVGRRALANI